MLSTLFKRSVSTSISSAFNKLNIGFSINSPKLFDKKTGLFGYELLSDPSGFYLLRENAEIEADRLVREAICKSRDRKMVQVFDQMSNCLCKVADMAEFVRMGHPQPRFSMAAEEASMAISAEVEKLNTHKELYRALRSTIQNGDVVPTTSMDDYVAKLFLFDFEQSGIHLNEEERKLVVQINEYILHTGAYFMNNTGKPRHVAKSQLSPEVQNCFHSDGDNVVVSGLFADSENELVREAAFKIYLHNDDHQNKLLTELLMARKKLATLCGFESYAQRAVRGSIADTPETVSEFLFEVSDRIKPLADKDYSEMLSLKQRDNSFAKAINPWDVPYYTSSFKQNKYSRNVSACSPYFSLGSCMDGLNLIFGSLFDVRMEVTDLPPGETWHSDVIKLKVIDTKSSEVLGFIYCDFFERQAKLHQDCHFTIQGGCELPDGSYQPPIVVLMLSLQKPSFTTPSLLTPHQVDNLFHEMGHAMHSMLARTPYQHITGTRCSTDLAEVPSILMEYFASDSRVLSQFAKHYITNNPIPSDLLNTWIESKKVFSASDTQLQTFYAILDQVYHGSDPLMGMTNTTEVLRSVQNTYYGLEHVEKSSWQLRFGHLVGYGAKYYAYLVSRAVAHSIWNKLFAVEPLSAKAGHIYRQEVLAWGGGKPPKDIVESVLEREVTPSILADSIVSDITSSVRK
ncbi:Mitochondrial intermediate peptidase [Halotydeus destructor]|nr:Mitochondrial intermediate peptidase [Halotydeus destructor]